MTTYVLVHGAWGGAHGFRLVRPLLAAHGHEVFTPSLTGIGERSHLASPQVNLTTHIQDVVNNIWYEDLSDIVLLGFSYGGMVVTGVADKLPERIACLVYLDAYVPESGQSMQDLRPRELPNALTVDPTSAETFRVNERDRAWVDRLCTPHPVACVTERLLLSGAYRAVRRKIYVRAAGYPHPAFAATYERVKGDPGWVAHTLPCGHDVMVDMPDALAEILLAT